MMAGMRRWSVLVFVGLSACSSSSFDVGSGDAAVDSGGGDATADSSVVDTGAADTGSTDVGDTGRPDLGTDTGAGDTSPVDAPSDAPPSDAPTDAPSDAPADAPADAPIDGGTCPRPPSTSTFPTDTLWCTELLAKYPPYFDDARTCSCDEDCNQKIDRGFCGCEAWVSEGNDAYPALVAMQERWKKLSCSVACPKVLCSGAGTAKCEKLTGSPLGKCRVGPG